jgi:uncharacterized OB-fold protein
MGRRAKVRGSKTVAWRFQLGLNQSGARRRTFMPIEKSPLDIYLEHLERGELAYQFSLDAGRPVFFPRVLCPFTGGVRLEWRISAGRGTVHATTTVHPPEGQPYNVALIDCDEGFRLMSRVVDITPELVCIGMRVSMRVHRPGGGDAPHPVFAPMERA